MFVVSLADDIAETKERVKNLIIVTNDDGIKSPGIVAAVNAVRGLGEIIVVAPKKQESSAGRAYYWRENREHKVRFQVGERVFPAWAVDGSPAVAARYALQLIAQRRPALLVSGINYGENVGTGVTISGTVGAALEAAAENVPALAVSLQAAPEFHYSHSTMLDFRMATYFARLFAKRMLAGQLPREMQLLNLNVPTHAVRTTPWRVTRASSQAYFKSLVKRGRFAGYDVRVDMETLEPDSDIYALMVDHVVSVTPLSNDLTAPVELLTVEKVLADAHT